jgi:hypothetical protein
MEIKNCNSFFDIKIGQTWSKLNELDEIKDMIENGDISNIPDVIIRNIYFIKHGYCNLELSEEEAIKAVLFLRNKGIRGIGYPIKYKNKKNWISYEQALKILNDEISKKHNHKHTYFLCENSDLFFYTFHYLIPEEPNRMKDDLMHVMSIDGLDGHVWTDDKFYEFFEKWQ